MRSLKRYICFFLLASLCMLIALFGVQVTPVHAEGMAYVRVIHASPDVGTVDVFVDGTELLSSFQFGVVTPYVPLPAGGHNVQVALIGTGVNAAVITQSIMVNVGTPYTIAAVGTKASGFSLLVFTDNNVVSGNDAKVRIYHLSPNAGSVSVSNGSNPVANSLTYQKASDYIAIPAGSYTFDATIPSNQTVPIDTNLKPWTVTSVFAIGEVNGKPSIQFVSAQVAGVPGMPGTGSDPHAGSENTQPFLPSMFAIFLIFLFLLLTAGLATRHYTTRIRRT
ncbi:MAG: DUF4397 domain-containing protein [Ktedonobacteraceae bacterium]